MMQERFDRRQQPQASPKLNVVCCDEDDVIAGFVFAHLSTLCNLSLVKQALDVKTRALMPTKPDIVLIHDRGSLEFIQTALDACRDSNIPVIITTTNTLRKELTQAGFVLGTNLLTRSYHFNTLIQMIRDLATTPSKRI